MRAERFAACIPVSFRFIEMIPLSECVFETGTRYDILLEVALIGFAYLRSLSFNS